MKILLAYQSGARDRSDTYLTILPTGLCYLHASLHAAGHDSLLANFSAWPLKQITEELAACKADIVGISQWTHNRHASMELARLCRAILPEAVIVMGGGHATFCYEEILLEDSPVDLVILGEGEAALLELASNHSPENWPKICGVALRVGDRIFKSSQRNDFAELDLLPIPAKYLQLSTGVDIELQAEFVVTSRGCPSSCHFCSSPDFWGKKVRYRSPESILEEILYIKNRYGLIYFSIRDDTFTADRNRIRSLCAMLDQQNAYILWNCQSRVTALDEDLLISMKRAGCECIQLGVESGSPRILDLLGKKIRVTDIENASELIRKVGINLSVYLITGVPEETDADISATITLLKRISPDDAYVSPLAYYPGTRMFRSAVVAGITSQGLFAESSATALYAVKGDGKGYSRIMRHLSRESERDSEKFLKKQKGDLGFCYVTNVIAAESYRRKGEYGKAKSELRELIETQPDNPWGWLLLGDIFSEQGKMKKARQCYQALKKLVPQHPQCRNAGSEG